MPNVDDEQRPQTPEDEGFYDFYATTATTTWLQNPLIDIPYMVFGQMILDAIFRSYQDLHEFETADAEGPGRGVPELRRVRVGQWDESSLLSADDGGFWCELTMLQCANILRELMCDDREMMISGGLRCSMETRFQPGPSGENFVDVYFLYAVRPAL